MKFTKKGKEYARLIIIGVLLYWGLDHYKLFLEILGYITDMIKPFLLGGIIAFILNVPMSAIEKRLFKVPAEEGRRKQRILKIKRPVSILLTFLLVIGIIVMVCWLVIPALIKTITQLSSDLPALVRNIGDNINNSPVMTEWLRRVNLDQEEIINKITSFLKDGVLVFKTLNSTISVASHVFNSVLNFIIGMIFAVYMLAQKETLKRQGKKIAKAFFKDNITEFVFKIARRSIDTFGKFLGGQCLEAVILGSLCGIGMLIFRFPNAAIISILVACTALLPIVGAFLGFTVGFLLICAVSFKQAVFYIIFMIILQQIEGNLIYPKVVGNSVGLPGLWVLFAVTVGGNMFGIVGMFLSVPACSVIYCTFAEIVNMRNLKKEQEKSTAVNNK